MAEYIEREKLIKHYENCIDEVKNTNGVTEDFEICLKALKNQPAVDVTEVRHGKWERKENKKVYWYACSLCGEEVPQNEYGDDYFSDYCPNCGAKMDLGDDE